MKSGNPLLVGITGGIGSGKSLITRIFQVLKTPVYDADSRAKELMTTDGIVVNQIRKEFGNLSYDERGALNRSYLAKEVFGNEVRLKQLNAIVHPRVALDFKKWVEENKAQGYLIKEAALLFESGSDRGLDKIVVVTAPEPLRVQRVLKRDAHRKEEEVIKIMASQWPEAEKIKKADFVICNDETALIVPQVLKLHEIFTAHH